MAAVVFVHGTGVREPEYTYCCWTIEQALARRALHWTVVRCAWGARLGVRFPDPVRSIPDYVTARGIGDDGDPEEALWRMLYEDPFFELRLLERSGTPTAAVVEDDDLPAPDEVTAAARLLIELGTGLPEGPLGDLLERLSIRRPPSAAADDASIADVDLAARWLEAQRAVAAADDVKRFLAGRSAGEADRAAIGRAVVAELTRRLMSDGLPLFTGATRDELVDAFVAGTGGGERSIGRSIKDRLVGIAQNLAVRRYVDRRRGSISDSATPLAGDVIFYQTRGGPIRDFIAAAVAGARQDHDRVVLLAHSLGGIACVDLLALTGLQVDGLITVGSQAPYLYEIDCLVSRRYKEVLPDRFPPWLNILDKRDILSYQGRDVFPGRVEDEIVDNDEPFPQSHSAYWSNTKVWDAIEAFLVAR